MRKINYNNYGDDSSESQSSTENLRDVTRIERQSGKNMCQGGKPATGKLQSSYRFRLDR